MSKDREIVWNYDNAVSQLKPLVEDLHKKTLKVCKMLYQAREALSNQGTRTDLKKVTPGLQTHKNINNNDLTSGKIARSWENFCNEIGLPKRTANYWLTSYDPEEDRLLTQDEIKQRLIDAKNIIFEDVRQHRYSGEPDWKPENWTKNMEEQYQLWLIENDYVKLEPKLVLPPEPEYPFGQFGLFSQDYLAELGRRAFERTSGDRALAFGKVVKVFEKVAPKGIKPAEIARISETAMAGLEGFPKEVRREIGIALAEQLRNQVVEEF